MQNEESSDITNDPNHEIRKILDNDQKRMEKAKEDFQNLLQRYLVGNPILPKQQKTDEFEVRFGTNTFSGRELSKIDYDNVVKQLMRSGFATENSDGTQMLRINYQDSLTDVNKMSNIRAEIVGIDLVQEYCRTNNIEKLLEVSSNQRNKVIFTRKSSLKDGKDQWIKPVDMFDMGFRVDYKTEENFNVKVPFIQNVIRSWSDRRKTFRYMNRVRFSSEEFPIFADISIIKTSKRYNKKQEQIGGASENQRFRPNTTNIYIPTYTIQDAQVFNNTEHYEIELEIDNKRVGLGTPYDTPVKLMDALRKCIRIILCGIQKCNYPIAFSERDQVLNDYMKVIKQSAEHEYIYRKININNKHELFTNFAFIGPGSITLQRENIMNRVDGSLHTSILENYTVTDKADGERKILFINGHGKIYLIDSNFNVEFTGLKTAEKTVFLSILDGEHIKIDDQGNPIQLYAAFDLYYINKHNFREKMFYPNSIDDLPSNFRLTTLKQLVDILKPSSLVNETKIVNWTKKKKSTGEPFWFDNKSGKITMINPKQSYTCLLRVEMKHFEVTSPDKSIFECCSNIMKRKQDRLIKYHTDGLIFTPTNVGVGGTGPGLTGPLTNSTWELSFKWKPVEQNTVDFLVTIKKDPTGKDEILHIFQEGKTSDGLQLIDQYKTLELMCGYSERDDGFLNPFNDLLEDNIPSPTSKTRSNYQKKDYIPYLFIPNDPYASKAYSSQIKLKDDGANLYMVSEEGEYFEEFMIVEFRYDMPTKNWIPLRVRYDKTAKLKNGEKQFGNAYRVANSNWHSIHYPVTEDMITTGENIPDIVIDEGVYYKGNNINNTQGMRDFHNLYVKRKLITNVASRGDTLIDYAVGMAGDLSKWVAAKLGFVFGIDISRDNIHNQKRGACSRYLNIRRDNTEMPGALFVVGDSGLNIRNKSAFHGDKDKMVVDAVFGKGPKDSTIIGKGTVKYYGIGEQGFKISSCQFALHYFFENPVKLTGFIQNLAECTEINGYFIGTCYDGETIFKMLAKKKEEESITFMTDDKNGHKMKICEIVKKYSDSGFPADITSLGYAIDVYQESINKMAREYLVNFEYFTQIMENYGFMLITNDEARQMGFPNNTGMFNQLFESMKQDIHRDSRYDSNYKDAPFMTSAEKSVSFMNRYFVFKKMITKDAAKETRLLLSTTNELDFSQNIEMTALEDEINKQMKVIHPIKGPVKKLRVRVKLQKMPSEMFSLPTASVFEDPIQLDAEEIIEDKDEEIKEDMVEEIKEDKKEIKKKNPNETKKRIKDMLSKMKN
uniref:mRNA (guanine-N(7))-methyltransferase n=1 Tax=viral metagenome TaxID=1070528 RepID=A0A6C0I0V1_9ZZZZ